VLQRLHVSTYTHAIAHQSQLKVNQRGAVTYTYVHVKHTIICSLTTSITSYFTYHESLSLFHTKETVTSTISEALYHKCSKQHPTQNHHRFTNGLNTGLAPRTNSEQHADLASLLHATSLINTHAGVGNRIKCYAYKQKSSANSHLTTPRAP
jgi:hypothetical protein